nr:MAG TPA: hypothetical protein [Bacteriophage sp.]
MRLLSQVVISCNSLTFTKSNTYCLTTIGLAPITTCLIREILLLLFPIEHSNLRLIL